MEKTIHQGRNIKRFREMRGLKQEALALELGDDWNQRKVSLLEQKEIVEPAILEQVSAALKLPVEVFQNFDEEGAVNIIANTITNNDNSSVYGTYHINPIEKIMELFERLLTSEKEKVELMKEILGKMK